MKDFIYGTSFGVFMFTCVMLATVHVKTYLQKQEPIVPIVINCPTGEKQIVIPDARKMEL